MSETLTDRIEIADLFAKLSRLLDEQRFDDLHTVYHHDIEALSPRANCAGSKS
ncbi:hypothetical protein Kisp01_21600 [Kineosporia sp. NBRC 101677]|uniref:nuclear transport factor 2 family protein n=1 Tax=Kineosporia sp. NBRC 101677 TaxID=3032197 RepID=UPI0024A0E1F5|nr:nuclear transport factor 2 family protein [Kineosporia sp. NBRC 101677]GLY15145.1 hypothetical protein Kisp01_21600 [Kineosporia sp. NBRC 101677]